MKILKVLVVCFVCLVFMAPSLAVAQDEPSITVYTQLWGKYLGGNGGIIYKSPVHQTGATVCYQGFCADLWGSYSIDGKNGGGKEGVDVTAWYGNDWIETGVGYFNIRGKGVSDVISPFTKLKHKFALGEANELTLFGKLELYWPVRGTVPQHGAIFAAGIAHTWHILPWLDFNHEPTVKFDNGAFGNDSAIIGQWKADLSWKISKHLTVQVPMLKASTPLTKVSDPRKTEFVLGAGVVSNFNWSDLVK
ncbi:MAG: hypothetical protein Q7S12_04595 [bacterium]|nr:hypothetical protein [bacterium]